MNKLAKILFLSLSVSILSQTQSMAWYPFKNKAEKTKKRKREEEANTPSKKAKHDHLEQIIATIQQFFDNLGKESKNVCSEIFTESFKKTRNQIQNNNEIFNIFVKYLDSIRKGNFDQQILNELVVTINKNITNDITNLLINKLILFKKDFISKTCSDKDEIQKTIAGYILNKVNALEKYLNTQFKDKKTIDIRKIFSNFVAETKKEISNQKKKSYKKEIQDIIEKNKSVIQSTTRITGLIILLSGEIVPFLIEISEKISKLISIEIEQLIQELGKLFSEHIVHLLKNKNLLKEEKEFNKSIEMKFIECIKLIYVSIEKNIVTKSINIMSPYIKDIIANLVDSFFGGLTAKGIKQFAPGRIDSLLKSQISNSTKKLIAKIEAHQDIILKELSFLIKEIIEKAPN